MWDSQANAYYNLPLSALAAPVLLNTMVANNSATLQDFTSLGLGFNEYSLVFENIVPSNNNGVRFALQVQSGGTLQNTNYINSAGGQIIDIDILQAATLGNVVAPPAPQPGFSGGVTMFGNPAATTYKLVRGFGAFITTTGTAAAGNCAGWWNPATPAPITGLSFAMTGTGTPTIASGTIKVYGSL